MEFNRGKDIKRTLCIGRQFGFSKELLDIESNDGKQRLYLTQKIIDKIKDPDVYGRKTVRFHQDYKFSSTFKKYGQNSTYGCNFIFRQVNMRIRTKSGLESLTLFGTQGLCGTYGFNGGEHTVKERMSPFQVKQCLEQLYNYLLTIKF